MRWRLAWKMQLAMALILVIFMLAFSGFLACSMKRRGLDGLHQQVRTMADEIVIMRQWLADHGGVWVRGPTGRYVAEERGFYLKVPAIVTAELSAYTERAQSFNLHITSLQPVNPANAPDAFERAAMETFSNSRLKEMARLETDAAGQRVYRYVRALYTEESCLKCHAQHGYHVGDVRGALTLTVPAEATMAAIRRDMIYYIVLGLGGLVLILLSCGFVIWRLVAVPLHQIEVATRSLAVGNLETRVEITSGDELQFLGESLNNMAAQLSQSILPWSAWRMKTCPWRRSEEN